MKKLLIILFISILISGFSCSAASASTSFTINSELPLYGVNFDVNDTDLIFRVLDKNDTKIFYVQYVGILGEEMDSYLPIVAMNNKGFFVSCQIQSPAATYTYDQNIQTMEVGSLTLDAAAEYGSVDDIIIDIDGQLPINSEASLHSLFVDLTGATLIVEAGNEVKKRDESFTLMTDLPFDMKENKYSGTIPEEEKARYESVYNYIRKNISDFNVNKAFEVLKSSAQEWEGGGTKCSMVFDPTNREIYIAMNRNYTKIWKVLLEKATMETWKGFSKQKSVYIGEGITSTEILHPDSFLQKYGLYLLITGVILIWIIIGSIIRHKRIIAFKPKEMEW